MQEAGDIKRIGLLTGNGKFPLFLCQAAKGHNIDIVVIAVKDELDSDLSKYASKIHWIELGQGKKVLEILNFNEPPNPRAKSVIFTYAVFTPQEEMKSIITDKPEQS